MKTRMTTLLLMFILTSLFADNAAYLASMTKNIELVYKAQTTEGLQQAVNAFVRIGNAEKTKWEPFYYEAFGYIMMATRETDLSKKDGFLDQAKTAIDKASGAAAKAKPAAKPKAAAKAPARPKAPPRARKPAAE